MHDMSLVFKCGWKMFHCIPLLLIRQIYLLFNKIHSLDSQKKKKRKRKEKWKGVLTQKHITIHKSTQQS